MTLHRTAAVPPPSPLSRWIDKGAEPRRGVDYRPHRLIKLRCPRCKQEREVLRLKVDSGWATYLAHPCADCIGEGKLPTPRYLDANGTEVPSAWGSGPGWGRRPAHPVYGRPTV